MFRFVVYLTFISWLCYYISLSKDTIKVFKTNKVNKEWVKKNFFEIFHFENLILIGIFVFFSISFRDRDQIWLVNILLFTAINLYLFINLYYQKKKADAKITNNDIPVILIIIILTCFPFAIYASTHKYRLVYYILFGYSFFNYPIVYLSKKLNDLIIRRIKKENEK